MNRSGIFCQPSDEVGTAVYVSVEGEYAGCLLISDAVREDAGRLIKWLHRRHFSTIMLTGDNEETAENVASGLGIESVYSELMPEDKVELLEEFREGQTEGEKVVFVGDGINDAPVLARADIGIAMGGLGSDAAIEAADVVLMDDDPLKIAKAIRISRKCLRIVYQNIVFAIGVKLACLALVALGAANMWLAIFADVGVMVLAVLNAIRALFVKKL